MFLDPDPMGDRACPAEKFRDGLEEGETRDQQNERINAVVQLINREEQCGEPHGMREARVGVESLATLPREGQNARGFARFVLCLDTLPTELATRKIAAAEMNEYGDEVLTALTVAGTDEWNSVVNWLSKRTAEG